MIANVNWIKEQAENGRQRNEFVRILIRWHLESKRPLFGYFSENQTEPLDFWTTGYSDCRNLTFGPMFRYFSEIQTLDFCTDIQIDTT